MAVIAQFESLRTRKRWHNLAGALAGISAAAALSVWSAPAHAVPDVQAVYLIPSDRTFKQEYQTAIGEALGDLQAWYAGQLGGSTFSLSSPVVQSAPTPHTASYYSTNDTGGDFATWFFYNVVNDGFALTNGQFDDPAHRWLYYIDAAPAPGQIGGAALMGVAVLPAADLLGLVGQQPEPVSRWIGGLGHEVGHTFGLPHPSTCEPVLTPECPGQALMWTGYLTYPDAFLLPDDKAVLLSSPFFQKPAPVPEPNTLMVLIVSLTCLVALGHRGGMFNVGWRAVAGGVRAFAYSALR